MNEIEAMEAAAVLAQGLADDRGISALYRVNPSYKVSRGKIDSDRLILTFERRVRHEDIEAACSRLGMPTAALEELRAQMPDAWRFYVGQDGSTTRRAYFELSGDPDAGEPGRHLGWKWTPAGEWYVTEYEDWGPPYPTPTPVEIVTSELSPLVMLAPDAVAHALVVLRLAATQTDRFNWYWSKENGERRGLYVVLPMAKVQYRPVIESMCQAFGVDAADYGPVLDWMTEPNTIAVGVDSEGQQYVTIYERARWLGLDPGIPWRYQ